MNYWGIRMNTLKSNGSIGMNKWYGIGMKVMGLRLDGMGVRQT